MNRGGQGGFTLIEVLVVVAVLGILAAIAVPSYTRYRLTSHRAEAKATLVEAAQTAERYFVRNNTYAGADAEIPATTPHNLYTVSMSVPDATRFTLTAIARGGQSGDKDCAALTLSERGTRRSFNQGGAETFTCW